MDEAIESTQLAKAVAEPARERPGFGLPQTQLVFDRGDSLKPKLRQAGKNSSQHLARGKLALRAVRPARRREANLPARPPRQLVKRAHLRPHQQVAGSGADAEFRVVADWRVGGVESEQQVRHDRAVASRRLECGGPQRLAADGPVDVGDPEQDELAALRLGHGLGFHAALGLRRRVYPAYSFFFTAFSTASIVSLNRLTISWSSSSVLVYAGASSTSSPAKPSGVECVELTRRPRSKAMSSTRVAASSSCGRNDSRSRGSTSEMPSRNPRPRTSPTISDPFNAAAS